VNFQQQLKKLLLEAYGQASVLNMFSYGDDHPHEGIEMHIETGKQLQATILHALKIVHDMEK